MPSQADITVKKNDGSTDITWTAVLASAGDKSPAMWRSLTVGNAPAFQPVMKMTSRSNGPATGRRVDLDISYPYTTTGTDGKTYLAEKTVLTVSLLLPNGMPTATTDEAVAQAMNLLDSTLITSCFKSGFAPT